MKTHSPTLRKFAVLFLAAALFGLSACMEEGEVIYRTWIDYPLSGDEFLPGTPIPIISNTTGGDSLQQFTIRVNDQVIQQSRFPDSGEKLISLENEWIPDSPGEYTIEIAVSGEDGPTLSKAQVNVKVLGELALPEPDLTLTDLSLVGSDQIRCDYSNLGAATSPEGREVWLDIYVGPSESELARVSHSNIGADRVFESGTSGNFTSASLSPVPTWPQVVKCVIDAGEMVPESDEGNNEIQTTLTPPVPLDGQCAAADLVAPVLVGPADGATLTSDPTFAWSYPDESCHPYSYQVDISGDPSFSDISWGFTTLDHTTTSRTWPLPAGTCYYWRVLAYVPDTTGPASSVRSLCIEGTPEPEPPTDTPTLTPTYTPRPPTDTPTPRPDTTPPSINNLASSENPISVPPCQPDSTTLSAKVSDTSGLSEVKLYYRVIKGSEKGSWQILLMNNTGGKNYQVTVGPNQLKASKDPYAGLILQYYVKAWDTKGNFAESKSGNVQIQYCVQ